MNARDLFRRTRIKENFGGPDAPPVEAPPETTPMTTPRQPPAPAERPDPWRRREVEPGEEPAPKAAYGMDQTYTDSKAQRVVANLLEDPRPKGLESDSEPNYGDDDGVRHEPGCECGRCMEKKKDAEMGRKD